jgi:Zn finger protein HypA/HybF involved in hydrogenase expression
MLDTILRFKIEDVRILLECKKCGAQATLKPDTATDYQLLRCPTCSASSDWSDVRPSIDAVVRGINSLRDNSKVDVSFCVMAPAAARE